MSKRREKIERGKALTAQSWDVLKSDASLLVFPVLSTISGIVAVAAILVPTMGLRGLQAVADSKHPLTYIIATHDPTYYIAAFASVFVATLIGVFFNVALAACATRSLRGEDTRVSEGLSAALGRIGPILGWTLVTTTVGLILQMLEEYVGFVGKIAIWIAGAAWSIATFFVVPAIALEGSGPLEALKRSVAVVKARWGEGATGAVIITAVSGFVNVAIVLVGVVGFMLLSSAPLVGAVVIALAAVAFLAVVVISSALNQIFRVAVYEYAGTGTAPGAFRAQQLEAAFDRR
ncbi:MAG: hypothetical protein JO082_03440 [Mycobacterium sp.]|nr:hypothetical protein [Mycobacterium sp.]MBV9720954.1 hypothetical protein [Mycobacterium sp.]